MFDLALLAPERLRPLRADEYMRLAETGAFDDERVELLAGVIVAMSPQGNDHMLVTARIHKILVKQVDDTWMVASHSSLRVSQDSVPEPDVWVGPLESDSVGEAVLVVEVSDSSVTKDREIKRHLYAAAKIPEYWLVDLRRRRVEIRTRPARGDYRDTRIALRTDTLRPVALAGVAVQVADFLPATPAPRGPVKRTRRKPAAKRGMPRQRRHDR